MRRIYFGTSFKHRNEYRSLYEKLKSYFATKNIEVYSFVFEYNGPVDNNKVMLRNALDEMDKSDYLIAEASYGSIGVGMEVGYFKGKGKKVIYLHKNGTFLDENMDGVSDNTVSYINEGDVLKWFEENITNIV